MNRRDLIELGELLEKMDRLMHEYIQASTLERREMLEQEMAATKEQLKKAAANAPAGKTTFPPRKAIQG